MGPSALAGEVAGPCLSFLTPHPCSQALPSCSALPPMAQRVCAHSTPRLEEGWLEEASMKWSEAVLPPDSSGPHHSLKTPGWWGLILLTPAVTVLSS